LKPVTFTASQWQNQDIKLFHGTSSVHITSIWRGINLSQSKDATDFGVGFYTTTNIDQALIFAKRKAKFGGEPAVFTFEVSRDKLAELDSIWFVRSTAEAEDYWKLVQSCRTMGRPNRGRNRWYDVAIGPVSKWYEERIAWTDYDQVSFHTRKALKLLDNSSRGLMAW
jgi:hypothetical protein